MPSQPCRFGSQLDTGSVQKHTERQIIHGRAVPATQAIREEDNSHNQLMRRVKYSDDCSCFQEISCSQKQASSRKATAITPVKEQSERYLIGLPSTASTKGVSP